MNGQDVFPGIRLKCLARAPERRAALRALGEAASLRSLGEACDAARAPERQHRYARSERRAALRAHRRGERMKSGGIRLSCWARAGAKRAAQPAHTQKISKPPRFHQQL